MDGLMNRKKDGRDGRGLKRKVDGCKERKMDRLMERWIDEMKDE